jgi:hypothetical protein
MSQLVNGQHQVKRGERRKAKTDDPQLSPLVQEPGTKVGQEPLAQNRRTIEVPTRSNEEDRPKPDRQHHGQTGPGRCSRRKRGLPVKNRRPIGKSFFCWRSHDGFPLMPRNAPLSSPDCAE